MKNKQRSRCAPLYRGIASLNDYHVQTHDFEGPVRYLPGLHFMPERLVRRRLRTRDDMATKARDVCEDNLRSPEARGLTAGLHKIAEEELGETEILRREAVTKLREALAGKEFI